MADYGCYPLWEASPGCVGSIERPSGCLLVDGVVAGDPSLTLLSGGSYGSNNGFDQVIQMADGTVVILDSKQIANGSAQLAQGAYDGTTQLSQGWVEGVLDNIDKTSPAYAAVKAALANGTLVTGVVGVNRTTGSLVVAKVVLPQH